MTKDLEDTLRELGPGYRAVVERLAAGDAMPVLAPHRRVRPLRQSMLAAASVVVLLGAVAAFLGRFDDVAESDCRSASVSVGVHSEYRLAEMRGDDAVREMIRTQNADGSWKNDFLTLRNANALAARPEVEARIACKKARRNLRARGLL